MPDEAKKIFTFKNGLSVFLRPYTIEDLDALDRWVRVKYMENVRDACYGLPDREKMDLRLAALDRAATLTFQSPEGGQILLSKIEGMVLLGYHLIDNPQITFDEFFRLVYPDGVISVDGVELIIDMMNALDESPSDILKSSEGADSESSKAEKKESVEVK